MSLLLSPAWKPSPVSEFTLEGPALGAVHRWVPSLQARSVTDLEGGLILNINTGRFHSLNGTGVVVWNTLKGNTGGVSATEVLHAMTGVFGSHPRMAGDLDRLLEVLEKAGLIQCRGGACGHADIGCAVDRPAESHAPSIDDSNSGNATTKMFETVATLDKQKGSGVRTIGAWFGFLGVSVVLRVGGFSRLHRMLRVLSKRLPRKPICPKTISKVCAAVNSAATCFMRRSWCLHRAAVTFVLLRLAGIPAEMVIGCQRVPFYSHAWVEIRRTVVNDNPGVKDLYAELDRF